MLSLFRPQWELLSLGFLQWDAVLRLFLQDTRGGDTGMEGEVVPLSKPLSHRGVEQAGRHRCGGRKFYSLLAKCTDLTA